jgi:hypothetical protein
MVSMAVAAPNVKYLQQAGRRMQLHTTKNVSVDGNGVGDGGKSS